MVIRSYCQLLCCDFQIHEPTVPADLVHTCIVSDLQTNEQSLFGTVLKFCTFENCAKKEFTCVCYGPEPTLFVGTNTGRWMFISGIFARLTVFLLVNRFDLSVGHKSEPVCDLLESRTQRNK